MAEENATKSCVLHYANKMTKEKILQSIPDVTVQSIQEEDSYHLLLEGDNWLGLAYLLKDYQGKIDLIYIDPPYGTNQEFMSYDGIKAYSDKITDAEFLEFLRRRLLLMEELLSPRGSIYVHIDKKIGHYVKVIMDEVFGEANYINEICRVKCNPKNFARKAYGNCTDSIFFYAKNKDNHIWNDYRMPLEEEEEQKLFPKVNKEGKRYTTTPLHAPGETKDGPTGGMWRGLYPPVGRHWRYSPEVLEQLEQEGLIEWSKSGNPRKILYAKGHGGKKVQDLWYFKDKGKSLKRYPTQKNRELLRYIIENSSVEGSIILDSFMGSGGFIVEGAVAKRKAIGIDSSQYAIKQCIQELTDKHLPYRLNKLIEIT